MAIAARLRHRVTISRWTPGAPDDVGHKEPTYVDDPEPTPANLQEVSLRGAREVTGPDLDQVAIVDAIVFLPITTAIDGRDRLKGVSPAWIAGKAWSIIGQPRDAGGRGRHIEIDAQRIRA